MIWQKVTIVGVGLLGGSLGLALKQHRLARQVYGYVRRTASIEECRRYGVADETSCDIAQAVDGADLIVLCTPIAQMLPLFEKMLAAIKRGVVVTDVGSVKTTVVDHLESVVSGAGGFFIGSHPMAGAEKMGVSAARADLFQKAITVLTPTPNSNETALERIEQLWRELGSVTLRLPPELHDDLVGRSSHLPHIVAAELANYVLSPAHPKEQPLLCANGFRDTTRIASGSPEMWRDIAIANRKNLVRVLGVFIEDLQEFQLALERQDQRAIQEFFELAKKRRDQWCGQGSSPE